MERLTEWMAAGGLALAVLGGAGAAQAAQVLDFGGLPDGNYGSGLDLGPASIFSSGLGVQLLTSNSIFDGDANRVFCARGPFTYSSPCGGQLSLVFDAPVTNLTLQGEQTSTQSATEIAAYNGATFLGSLPWNVPGPNPKAFDFSGFGAITELKFLNPNDFFAFGNVQFEIVPTGAVPLPAGVMLGGSALAALGRARRRG